MREKKHTRNGVRKLHILTLKRLNYKMTKKLLSIEIQGNHNLYSFHFVGNPADIPTYEAEGFKVEVVDEVIPCDIEMITDKSLAH